MIQSKGKVLTGVSFKQESIKQTNYAMKSWKYGAFVLSLIDTLNKNHTAAYLLIRKGNTNKTIPQLVHAMNTM